MSKFISKLAPSMDDFLDYYAALGHSRNTYSSHFISIDRFFANKYPDDDNLTQTAVMEWLGEQTGDVQRKATGVRTLGKYMSAVGKDAYVLPAKAIRNLYEARYAPYIFTDAELSSLFRAVDETSPLKEEPFLNEILPVFFRLIYTCGLRPNEARTLECGNVNLKNGEILITNTKRKKERFVVMSADMLKLCRVYEKRRIVFARGSQFFFPSWSGGVFSSGKLTKFLLDCWTRAYPNVEKLPHVRLYDFRHRFATAALNRWLDSGQDLSVKLPYLRAYMGHNDLTETLYYVHLLPETLTKSPGIDWSALVGIMPEVTVCPE